MATFKVTVTKKIETTVFVMASDAEEAKALAWVRLPEHVDDWRCDVFKGSNYKVEQLEG